MIIFSSAALAHRMTCKGEAGLGSHYIRAPIFGVARPPPSASRATFFIAP